VFVLGSIAAVSLPVFDTTPVFITVQYKFIEVKMANLLKRK